MLTELTATPLGAEAAQDLAALLRLPTGFDADPAADAALRLALTAAQICVEAATATALTRRRFRIAQKRWGLGVDLPLGPVTGLLAVTTVDADGLATAATAADFRVEALDGVRRVVVREGRPVPTAPAGGRVSVDFEAGFGPSWADVPAALRLATISEAAARYEKGVGPEGGALALSEGTAALLAPYRRMRL